MDAKKILVAGLKAMGVENLSDQAFEKLPAYCGLLLKWNRVYNLTACKDPQEVLTHHLLDSLSILPWVDAPRLLDVGSGGGLPGIPLAIARPEMEVTMVEAIQKKTAFLRQATIELELPLARVCHDRVENISGAYPLIVSRAFSSLPDFIDATRPLLAPEGRWLAMKGRHPGEELSSLPKGIRLVRVVPLEVPGLGAERHLVILEPSAG